MVDQTLIGEAHSGKRVRIVVRPRVRLSGTCNQVRLYHLGWAQLNDHYRTSRYCWPMYLRILRRSLEYGESVPYEQRLDV